MRTEKDTPIDQRFLTIAGVLTEKSFEKEKRSAINYCSEHPDKLTEENKEALKTLNNFSLSEHYRALIVMSCYADVPAYRSYNAIFDISSLGHKISTKAIVQFGIFFHKLPISSLLYGHHQLVIIHFPDGVPTLIDNLSTNTASINIQLGLGDM